LKKDAEDTGKRENRNDSSHRKCMSHNPVDLPLPLSQTKHNRSAAPVEADVDSATYDMVAQCGASNQLKLNLLSTLTRL
jgi:hypothetical protein